MNSEVTGSANVGEAVKVIRILRVPQVCLLGVCVGPLIGLAAYRFAV